MHREIVGFNQTHPRSSITALVLLLVMSYFTFIEESLKVVSTYVFSRSIPTFKIMKNKSGYYKPGIPAEEKIRREKGFTLDCVAVGTLSTDRESFKPKLAAGIPPYNSQNDETLKNYFKKPVIKQTLSRTGQDNGGESMSGKQADFFNARGTMGKYINSRNKAGAGYSKEEVAGHQLFMSNPKPNIGYNGEGGYRRNTFDLRNRPSVFEN